MTLTTSTLRDDHGRPSPAAQVAALAEAKTRLTEIDNTADTASAPIRIPTASVEDALEFATQPGVKARHSRSKQDAEWRRAALEVRTALPADRLAGTPIASDVRLVACSAMLRATAGVAHETWREHLEWARRQPSAKTVSGASPWEQHLLDAFRRALPPTPPDTSLHGHGGTPTSIHGAARANPEVGPGGTSGTTLPSQLRARVSWAWRSVELMRAMLNAAAAERPDVFKPLANLAIPRDLTTRMETVSTTLGLDFDPEEFRPRYARDEVSRLLVLLSDPRFPVRTVLARTSRGLPGAYAATRMDLTEVGDQFRLRIFVGGRRHPNQFTYVRLNARASALLRAHLRTTYARWEDGFDPNHATTNYSFLTGHRWTGAELVDDPEGRAPDIDARFRLLLDLGVEQRHEQMLRLRRSQIAKVLDREHFMIPELGIAENKQSGIRLLSQRQQVALALEMEVGVLQDLEDAYRAGRINDYYIFSGCALAQGHVPFDSENPVGALDDRTINTWCRALENALQIEYIEGRAMRGWRRSFADLYDGWTSDDVVKTLITGHRQETVQGHGATRRDVYLQRATTERLEKAAWLIDYARTTFAETGEPPVVDAGAVPLTSAEPYRVKRPEWKHAR